MTPERADNQRNVRPAGGRTPGSKQPVTPPSGAAEPALAGLSRSGHALLLQRIRESLQTAFRDGAHQVSFQAMGTRCQISFAAPLSQAPHLIGMVVEWVAAFEAKYSRFIPDSLIGRINAAAGRESVAIDPETEQIFALCDQMHFITGGVFDPSALPLIQVWNWKSGVVPSGEAVAAAKRMVGWRKVQRTPGRVFLPEPGMGIDLGGMGKEYAVDRVAQMLGGAGITGALVDFGADVRVVGTPPDGRPAWHIGLDDPREPGRCWCGLGVREGAVATSGDYIRRFEIQGRRYGHILDIRTGYPVDNSCYAVSVLAPSCTLAGMLSTALFVLGAEAGMRLLDAQFGAAGAMVTDHGILPSRRFYEHVVS